MKIKTSELVGNPGGTAMMTQFVVWSLHGVSYLCLRVDDSCFVQTIRRL